MSGSNSLASRRTYRWYSLHRYAHTFCEGWREDDNSNAIRHKVQTEGGDIQLKSWLDALTLRPPTSQPLITTTQTLRPQKDMTQKRSDHVTLNLKSGRIVRPPEIWHCEPKKSVVVSQLHTVSGWYFWHQLWQCLPNSNTLPSHLGIFRPWIWSVTPNRSLSTHGSVCIVP